MCKYVKHSHPCSHKSLKLTDICEYALSSSPGSCGRMYVMDRKYVKEACENCMRKQAQLNLNQINDKIGGWMKKLEPEEYTERVAPITRF